MPKFYSLGGELVSKEEYEKAHGINQPEIKEEVKIEEEPKEEVKVKKVFKKAVRSSKKKK